MATYRDKSGKSLVDYPRPSVAVDTAVLSLNNAGALSVLLAKTATDVRLPGTFLHESETLADAVLRSLAEKVGVDGLTPTQLHVFDDPARDDRGWVLSVAHLDTVRTSRLQLDATKAELRAVTDHPELPYGHGEIVALAVETIRSEYNDQPDPRDLLEHEFTLRDLRMLHQSIAGIHLAPDTFRRTMEPQLSDTGRLAAGTVGKPARLFTKAVK